MKQIPDYFGNRDIDNQITAWLKEGHSVEDIVSQANHTWPDVPKAYILATIQVLQMEQKQTTTPEPDPANQFLALIHGKRMNHIECLEKQIAQDDCPMSVHTLYRGLLRDAEMHCFKLMAFSRDRIKHEQKIEAARRKEEQQADLAHSRRHSETLKALQQQYRSPVDDDEEEEDDRLNVSATRSFSTMTCLFGFCLGILLALLTARNASEGSGAMIQSYNHLSNDCTLPLARAAGCHLVPLSPGG
jgi:hypothetical protein